VLNNIFPFGRRTHYAIFMLVLAAMTRYIPFFILCLLLVSCKPETYTPKPRGYYAVSFPKHEYRAFDNAGYPYTFEYPVYGNIVKDTMFFDKKAENPWWIDIDFPSIGGRLYISYKEISAQQTFDKLLGDAHELTYWHDKKANYIEPQSFVNPYGVTGVLFNVGGDAASAYQFIASDSVKHYLRGALYFNVTPNADSLKPMNEFLAKDIQHLLMTLKWR
jgi:gliding motility-associated lipoprotein GldD